MNLGSGDGRTAGARGARHAAPGPGVWRPGCGDRGRHRGPAAAVAAAAQRAGPVAVLEQGQRAAGGRPRKPGAAQAVTDAGALDEARLEVAVDATGCRRRSRPRRAARPWRAGGGLRCVASPGRDQHLAIPGLKRQNRHHRADAYLAQLRPGRTAGTGPQPLLRRAGLDRVPAGAISISSRARHTFLVAHCVPSPISVSRPLRRRYRCRTARLGSKPGSVLIAPEPGGGLGRGPGFDLVAFGERPDRLGARAAGHRPGRPRAHDRPGGAV